MGLAGRLPSEPQKKNYGAAGLPLAATGEKKGEDPFAVESGRRKLPVRRKALVRHDLQGVRSLEIAFQQDPEIEGRVVCFRSLGVEPLLAVTLVNRMRYGALGWAVALAVGLVGLAWTKRTLLAKLRYLLAVGLPAAILPLAIDNIEVVEVANMAFFAVSLLVPYYLLAGLVRWCCTRPWRRGAGVAAQAGVAALAIMLAAGLMGTAGAAEPFDAEVPAVPTAGPSVTGVVPPGPAVEVPDDVILRPYDPKAPNGIAEAKRLLVPYAKYVELWNRAHPDKRLEAAPPPASYGLSGASYQAVLEGDNGLVLSGHMEIDVYAEGLVGVPLRLGGGVLARADLDGKPARLTSMGAGPAAGMQESSGDEKGGQSPFVRSTGHRREALVVAVPAKGDSPPFSGLVLYLSQKGRHKLDLEVRMSLTRRGGWRIVKGEIPAAEATAVSLRVPEPQTEIRLSDVADRAIYESKRPNEVLETGLGPDGSIGIQWRPKVAQHEVDQTLTVRSAVTLDVQEEGVRLAWQLQMDFRGKQRESFRLLAPKDYLVEKVTGANVRGWELRSDPQAQVVQVSLLKAAAGSEHFTVYFSRGATGASGLKEFDVPTLEVEGAALQSGRLLIRRSPLLEVRILNSGGTTRTELDSATAASLENEGRYIPLGIRPLAVLDFAATPLVVRLAAAPLVGRLTATTQTLLRISAHGRSVESRITLSDETRPLHAAQIRLPDDFELQQVSLPGDFQWAVTRAGGRQLLSIYLAAGREGELPVLLCGRLTGPATAGDVPLPRFAVCGARGEEGQIAVQVDPAFDVETVGLHDCQSVLADRLYGWLAPEQRGLTRLAICYQQPDYGGRVRLVPRKPSVSCYTITNVRVTSRAVEETTHLVFTIRNAGIRELCFLLPAGKEEPQIEVPMLRQKTIERVGTVSDPWLRVRLELQAERMGELRVQVLRDAVLTEDDHSVVVPSVETGRTDRQFVARESAGRDEVLVQGREGLEPLGRQQKEWQIVKDVFGGHLAQAYMVTPGARRPKLVFRTRRREAVETSGARIGLAETEIVVDAHGAYRAQTTYWLDNATEQFLVVRLPRGAELWTAEVAGEPVKPAADPVAPDRQRVRLPLVKTAPGDLNYPVVLKYAGALPPPAAWERTDFPLLRTANVNVELSQVKLLLPATRRWLAFEGTMHEVGADDLAAGRMAFNTRLAERLVQTVRSGDQWAQQRAAGNLANLSKEWLGSAASQAGQPGAASQLSAAHAENARVLQEARQELEHRRMQASPADSTDNRIRLKQLYAQLYAGQQTANGRDVIGQAGHNWGDLDQPLAKTLGREEADVSSASVATEAAAAPQPEETTLERYQRRIAQQSQQQMGLAASLHQKMAAGSAERQAVMGFGGEEDHKVDAASVVNAPAGGRRLETGLASLSIALPELDHARVYCFTTPRGEVEISAWTVSQKMLDRLAAAAVAVVGLLAAWLVLRVAGRASFAWLGSRWTPPLLIIVGFFAVLAGLFPVAGLAAVLVGTAIAVARFIRRGGGEPIAQPPAPVPQ